ncbi:DUF4159 domain-containing protein [uncultured Paludibaculum sp.]|uniref:DUF4159 domain-containing protein n=1 Tax=uncultured Paludibaculum sp. TaxID=1765020 RepID=UPI002AABF126|nr:DUF4159 domain-containing protein [uncultured Paludibaculum sp.]
MNPRTVRWLFFLGIFGVGLVCAFQKPFREYPGFENENDPLPPDFNEKTEWSFARLMYPPMGGFRFRRGGDWSQGDSFWTMDYPRADRHFARALRRLTRIHVRSVEQPVNLDDGDDPFNWPWMYGVEVGHWNLTDAQARKMREYLLRGGFFMCDDFHGTREWAIFSESMQRVFPDRPIVEIESRDPIFHVLYDLDERYQIPGEQFLESGRTYERDGYEPHWRGIYDDHGRLMVAICFNMDIGDSLEWADTPAYPEKYSALGIRIAANYVVYSMTH